MYTQNKKHVILKCQYRLSICLYFLRQARPMHIPGQQFGHEQQQWNVSGFGGDTITCGQNTASTQTAKEKPTLCQINDILSSNVVK